MFDQKLFGEKLKLRRKQLYMTQEEAALRIGVTGQAISKWENGECLPDCYNLKMISEIYGVSVDELFRTDFDEKHIEKINIGDAEFELVERPESVYAGKITYAKSIADGTKLQPVTQEEKAAALAAVTGELLPARPVTVSINFWLAGRELCGMGFVKQTVTAVQPEGVDVITMPKSLYLRGYTSKGNAGLLTAESCEIWELFSYMRNYVMPRCGCVMAKNGAQELEVFDAPNSQRGYAYIPVEKTQ